jgi:hypothetical protein
MGHRNDVEVVGSVVDLVVLGMTSKLDVMHLVVLHCLDGLALLLAASEDASSSYWWRLNSSILTYIAGDVVSSSVGSGIGRLHDVILSTSLFSNGLEGSVVIVVTMVRSCRPPAGVLA